VQNTAGFVEAWLCRAAEAIVHFERAMRLSPRDPEMVQILSGLAMVLTIAGRYDAALDASRRAIAERPGWAHAWCENAIALSFLGRREEARAAALRFREVSPASPRVSAEFVRRFFIDPEYVERRIGALREADLAE
jgi:Flp pilus assembly protein TadD